MSIRFPHAPRWLAGLALLCSIVWHGAVLSIAPHVVAAFDAARPLPPNQPERGLIYDGLTLVASGPCVGMLAVQSTFLCTHGPDPLPPLRNVHQRPAPLVITQPTTTLACDGDGSSGPRTQVLYVHAADVPDRYGEYLASFQQWAADADAIYQTSAAETGGMRQIRWVHDGGCNLIIPIVSLSAGGDDTFSNTISELQAQGYNRSDRKYMLFMDAQVYCGVGSILGDDQPGAANRNNGGSSYGRTDTACWSGSIVAHEHMHNLGGVQNSAPHASGGYHCTDEWDLMCYSDAPNHPAMQTLCAATEHDQLFDCNHDDYYNTNPQPSSYLATHWNAANSTFLRDPNAPPTPTASATTTTRPPTATPTSLLSILPPLLTPTILYDPHPSATRVVQPTFTVLPTMLPTRTSTTAPTRAATTSPTRTPLVVLPTVLPTSNGTSTPSPAPSDQVIDEPLPQPPTSTPTQPTEAVGPQGGAMEFQAFLPVLLHE